MVAGPSRTAAHLGTCVVVGGVGASTPWEAVGGEVPRHAWGPPRDVVVGPSLDGPKHLVVAQDALSLLHVAHPAWEEIP